MPLGPTALIASEPKLELFVFVFSSSFSCPNRDYVAPPRFRRLGRTNEGCDSMIDDLWYKNAVFYCLSVGTYMDANGDGIGDFKGLMRRLDYLQGLGITTIWLMPFQPSPGKDDGYDVSDYYGVNPTAH
jgi:pullulanase/glycogen debranching enzyme